MANVIADSMYGACNDSGNDYLMMDSIVDYRSSDKELSVSSKNMVHRGRSFMRGSTVGCKICIQWRYGSISWQDLKDMKESHILETAEYATDQEIDHNPSFNCWVKAILKKILRTISLVNKRNSRYLKKTDKFGIEVSKSVVQVYDMDKNNGNSL